MLKCVVVLRKGLAGVERWVEIGQLHFADSVSGELRQLREARERMKCVASDELIARSALIPDVANGPCVAQKSNLGDAVVAGRQPLIRVVLVRKEPLVLVGPGQLKATLVP